jgi:hypothetical protein
VSLAGWLRLKIFQPADLGLFLVIVKRLNLNPGTIVKDAMRHAASKISVNEHLHL